MVPSELLSDEDVATILSVPKFVVDPAWRSKLLPPKATAIDHRGRLDFEDLTGPVRGKLHAYSRQNLNLEVVGDWSVGLIFTDYADRSYRVLRCNGPHPSDHKNTIEGSTIVRHAHIHRLTERYQLRGKPDGYAEPTDRYSNIHDAINVFAEMINLQVEGQLFV
jgi:hypothetical protein